VYIQCESKIKKCKNLTRKGKFHRTREERNENARKERAREEEANMANTIESRMACIRRTKNDLSPPN
jgi:hypothetical protein